MFKGSAMRKQKTTRRRGRAAFFGVTIAAMVAIAVPAQAASISGVVADSGPVAGGTAVTIDGTGFGFTALAGSGDHNLALRSDNVLYSWGRNDLGQLGNGTTVNEEKEPAPVDMSGALAGKTITQIAAGESGSLVLASDNTLYSWGKGTDGDLGNGANLNSSVPVAVDMTGVLAGKTITQISMGISFSLVLASDGTMFTWGNGDQGELGNGSAVDSNVPVEVDISSVLPAGRTIVAADAGSINGYAIDDAGFAYAWGWGFYGQIGDGTNDPVVSTPRAVDVSGVLAGQSVTQISGGGSHALVLTAAGNLYSWGYENNGRLGNGNTGSGASSNVPVAVDMTGVLAGRTITSVKAGTFHSVALDSTGAVSTWGYGVQGAMGTNSNVDELRPVLVDTAGALAGKTVTAINGGRFHSSALTADGALIWWGFNNFGISGGNPLAYLVRVPTAITMPDLAVTFDGVAGTSVERISATQLTVVTPQNPQGFVDVEVSVGGNSLYSTDSAVSADGYEYVGPELAATGAAESGTLAALAVLLLVAGAALIGARKLRSR